MVSYIMPIQLDIDLLRSFAVVAETGVLSRAAEQVGRTQAAISMQMKRLEEAVNQPLLTRNGRGVTLTMHGERLLAHAQKILRTHDEAVAELSGVSLSGNLRLGCPDDYAMVFLPPLLRGFSRQHPQVSIDVVCAPTPRLLERLENHVLDVAIVSLPDDPYQDQIIRREPLVWVGCKGSDASRLDPLQLALSDPDTLDHQAAKASLDRVGRPYRVAYASGSIAGLTAVVRSGQAIAVLTETAVPADLQILPVTSGLPMLPAVGITLKLGRRHPSPLLNTFEAHVRSVLPSL
ncbi:MAG TPA: LysR family transcriptional regulator [Stellaceae bacterium]|nr:LysR family transcriptional regulator [Stellaceae bacterium]